MRRSTMLLGLAMAAACDANLGPGGAGSLAITPRHVLIQPGDTVVLAATTTAVLATSVQWKSLNSSIASVDSLGRVIGLATGVDSIQVAASTDDSDLADTSTVGVSTACPGAPFIANVTLAGTSSPAHLESIAAPVDVIPGGLCSTSTAQRLLLVVSSLSLGDQVVASDTVPQPIPDRWRPTMTFDPATTTSGGSRRFPPGDYTLSVVWTGTAGGTAAAALPITIRTP